MSSPRLLTVIALTCSLLGSAARIENALLASLEQGVRTGDFGDAAKPALGTMDFVREVAKRLGQKPASMAAVPEFGSTAPGVHASR